MKTIKALSKQLFGSKYESVVKSLLVATILFWTIYAVELRITIAPFILYLTSTFFTAGVMGQMLTGRWNKAIMQGMFMIPFENIKFIFSYVLTLGAYILITKTLIIWALFFAAGIWNVLNIVVAFLCVCMACVTTAAIYLMCRRRHIVLSILWGMGILTVLLFVHQIIAILAVDLVSIIVAIIYLSFSDAYDFYYIAVGKKASCTTDRRGNVFFYLMRYLMANKSYLINTIGLCVVACFLPLLFSEFQELKMLPIGLAILCLNTPICTLLSSDTSLEQAIRVLPRQFDKFCVRYCLFIFVVNTCVSGIYLCSWQFINRGICISDVVIVLLFTLQSAILSVILECKRPIRRWKTESDLWHHPRKYIVPLIMLLMAVVVSTWTQIIFVWLAVLLIECCILFYVVKRS